jgi:hypothetical protein
VEGVLNAFKLRCGRHSGGRLEGRMSSRLNKRF